VISRVDHTIELLLLLIIISVYYIIYITSRINCHLIMLYVLYKQVSSHLMTGTLCVFLFTKSSDLPLYYFIFFSIRTIMLLYIIVIGKHPVMLEDLIQEMLEDILQA
jgi:hypothetical protein